MGIQTMDNEETKHSLVKYFARMRRRFKRNYKAVYYSDPDPSHENAFIEGYRAGFHGGYTKHRLEQRIPNVNKEVDK